ncbi:MAG: ParB/RepB/Spo0J family partition protein [Candidatus Neomarinimicrobiota bacterium]
MAKQRLGRGLNALIPTPDDTQPVRGTQPNIAVDLIDPNPLQPRKEFGGEGMDDLVASIKSKGVLQPLTVRESADGRYQLVAGERRLRAAKTAGLAEVPAYVLRVESDVEMMEYALIENIQREDLNPIEQAEAFALLNSKYDLKQEEIAEQVGISRPAVANLLRLLRLPGEIKESLIDGRITAGHARALLGLPQPALIQGLWKKIVEQGLSVRQTEAAVQDINTGRPKKSPLRKEPAQLPTEPPKPSFLNHVEVELLGKLSTKVRVKDKGNDTGAIEISYYSQDDLERILDIILDGRNSG